MRNKLIKLLEEAHQHCWTRTSCLRCKQNGKQPKCHDHLIADHLIANGMTVQQWIPAKERLPEKHKPVLAVDGKTGEVLVAKINDFGCFSFYDGRGHGAKYWMPLPEPPKEGTENA